MDQFQRFENEITSRGTWQLPVILKLKTNPDSGF